MKNLARFFTGMAVPKFGEKTSLCIESFHSWVPFSIIFCNFIRKDHTYLFRDLVLRTLYFLWLLQIEAFFFLKIIFSNCATGILNFYHVGLIINFPIKM